MKTILLLIVLFCATTFSFAQMSITSVSPAKAKRGDVISITGFLFNNWPIRRLNIGGNFIQSYIVSPTLIVATVPNDASSQNITIGWFSEFDEEFTYADANFDFAPTITNFAPSIGIPGTLVTIDGINFEANSLGINSNNLVFFGSGTAEILSATKSQLIVKLPHNAGYSRLSYSNGRTQLSVQSNTFFTPTFQGNVSLTGSSFTTFTGINTTHPPMFINLSDDDNNQKPSIFLTQAETNNFIGFEKYKNSSSIGSPSVTKLFELGVGNLSSPPIAKTVFKDMDNDGVLDAVYLQNNNLYLVFFYGDNSTSAQPFPFISNIHNTFAIGDLNNDGVDEIVVNTPNELIIYQKDKFNIPYNAIATFTGNSFSDDIQIADMDNDGKQDIVVSLRISSSNKQVKIYKNSTCSTTLTASCFTPQNELDIGFTKASFKIADLNNDKLVDIIVYNHQLSPAGINLFQNNSTGNAMGYAKSELSVGNESALDLTVGDLNGDSRPDIAFLVNDGTNSLVHLFENNSTANGFSFVNAGLFTTSGIAKDIIINDLDGDYKPEIIITQNSTFEGIKIFKNHALGTAYIGVTSFAISSSSFVITTPSGTLQFTATINGNATDQTWDAKYEENNVNAPPGPDFKIQNGAFIPSQNGVYDLIFYPKAFDAATALYQQRSITVTGQNIFISNITPIIASPGDVISISGSNFATIANNNYVEIGGMRAEVLQADLYNLQVRVPDGATYGTISASNAVKNISANSLHSFLPTYIGNNAAIDTSSLIPESVFQSIDVTKLQAADMDGDGFTDMVVAHKDKLTIYLNTAAQAPNNGRIFVKSVDITHSDSITSIHIQDMNQDGKSDIIVAGGGSLKLYTNNTVGNLAFTEEEISGDIWFTPISIKTIDNKKKTLDILVMSAEGYFEVYYFGKSDFDIENRWRSDPPGEILNAKSFEIADLNNDSELEIVVNVKPLSGSSPMVYIMSLKTGNLELISTVESILNCTQFKICDIDGDRNDDIVYMSKEDQKITILQSSNSPGQEYNFVQKAVISLTGFPTHFQIGDINGDQKPDIIVADSLGSFYAIQNNATNLSFNQTSFNITNYVSTAQVAQPSTALLIVADFDDDQKPDVALSNVERGDIRIFKNMMGSIPIPTNSILILSNIEQLSILNISTNQLQFEARLFPDTTVIPSIIWEVIQPTGKNLATIDSNGKLRLVGTENGIITVSGSLVGGLILQGYYVVSVTGIVKVPEQKIISNENLVILGAKTSPCLATFELNVPKITGQIYQWYYNDLKLVGDTNNVYKPVVAGQYYVIATDTVSYKYETYNISFVNNVKPQIIKTDTLLTVSESADSYQWHVDNIVIKNATAKSLRVWYNGSYYVVTKNNADGCRYQSENVAINQKDLRFALQSNLIIGEDGITNYGPDVVNSLQVKVYPNPASGLFDIEVLSGLASNSYQIADMMGRVVEQGILLKSGSMYFAKGNKTQLPKGIYVLSVSNESQKKSIKLVIE